MTETLNPVWYGSALAALLYLIVYNRQEASARRSLVKTAGVAGLAGVAFLSGGPVFLVLALLASALGDYLLAAPGDRRFMAGVVAFAVAHACYIPLFIALGAGSAPLALWQMGAAGGLVLISAALLFGLLWPHLGVMKGPLAFYFLIIVSMCVCALALPASAGLGLVMLGVVAFAVSDMILGVEMFTLTADSPWRRLTSPAIWILYYGGQALITWGVLAA